MIPIPSYLKEYAFNETQQEDFLSFQIKCPCGCDTFTVHENCYTDDEASLVKKYQENYPKTGWHTIRSGIAPDGTPYPYIRILWFFKKRLTFPKAPTCMNVHVIKVICSQCKKEIILFDSRAHGYDGIMSPHREEDLAYLPSFRQKGDFPCQIEVSVENELSLDAFQEEINEPCSQEVYSNSFSDISIYGVDGSKKKKLLYDFETS